MAPVVNELPAKAGDARDMGSIPVSGRFPGVGNSNPFQLFLAEKFHGQRSQVGYSPWGCKESDMTEYMPPIPGKKKIVNDQYFCEPTRHLLLFNDLK